MIKTAAYKEGYEAGVKLALAEAGITKTAGPGEGMPSGEEWLPTLLGPIGAGIAAPEGTGWESAGKTWLGGIGGTALGGLGGAGAGAGIGALIAALAKKQKGLGAGIGALAGANLGALGGMGAGSLKGYRWAQEDE